MKQRLLVAAAAVLFVTAIGLSALAVMGDTSTYRADAQDSSQTWNVVDMGSWRAEDQVFDGKPVTGRAFVEQLPAECDLFVSPHSDSIFYYACPFDWEPIPD